MRRGTQIAILAILLATRGGAVAWGTPPKPTYFAMREALAE